MCKFNPKNKGRRIDPCMKPLIKWLNNEGNQTIACCCGHEKYPMTIIKKIRIGFHTFYFELLSGKQLNRTKRFYKKDKQGYYYIPELLKSNNKDAIIKEPPNTNK